MVNYVFGQGPFMAPSNMLLKVGTIAGYNNKIVIAGPDQQLGLNSGFNVKSLPVDTQIDLDDPLDIPADKPDLSQKKCLSRTWSITIVAIAVGLITLYFLT